MSATGNVVYLCPLFNGKRQYDSNGVVAVNGTLYSYINATSNAVNAYTYTSNSGLVLNPNPVVYDSTGMPPQEIWIPQSQFTDFFFYDSYGVLLESQLNVLGVNDPTFASSVVNNAIRVAKQSYFTANLAQNTAILALLSANGAQACANFAANVTAVLANGNNITEIFASNLNFMNTATVNVTAVVNASAGIHPQANVSFTVNANTVYTTTANSSPNGWINLASNFVMQFGNVHLTSYGGGVSVTFPEPFPSYCAGVQLIMESDGSGDDAIPRPYDVTPAGFLLYFDSFGGTFPASSNIFWLAYGF